MAKLLTGWRYAAFIGGVVGAIGLACYPIIIYPMLHADEYKKIQKMNRAGIRQEDIQPGSKLGFYRL